jgi:hypothetical protein
MLFEIAHSSFEQRWNHSFSSGLLEGIDGSIRKCIHTSRQVVLSLPADRYFTYNASRHQSSIANGLIEGIDKKIQFL